MFLVGMGLLTVAVVVGVGLKVGELELRQEKENRWYRERAHVVTDSSEMLRGLQAKRAEGAEKE
ncbi:MAG TPA: hypothetical protein VJ327_09170 [Patescibacteria group bacterium]|nr:hypothetical protein [Patescibacteria group bacterium]